MLCFDLFSCVSWFIFVVFHVSIVGINYSFIILFLRAHFQFNQGGISISQESYLKNSSRDIKVSAISCQVDEHAS